MAATWYIVSKRGEIRESTTENGKVAGYDPHGADAHATPDKSRAEELARIRGGKAK